MQKILIADDSSFSRLTIKKMIQNKYDFEIIEANNGNEAIELYKSEKPTICTMDIMMPECDGIEALKEILNFDKEAKVIMCSEVGQSTKVIQSSVLGAKAFLIKPITSEDLYSTIDNTLKLNKSNTNNFDEKLIQKIHSIDSIIENKNDTYSVRLRNDSLINAGFLANDLLLIESNTKPIEGDLVSAEFKGNFVFGYLNCKENETYISFANPSYKPIKIDTKDINGVVTGSVRKVMRKRNNK